MTKSYPTGPCKTKYDCAPLFQQISVIKQVTDLNGVQIDMTFKPEGIRFTIIKKYPKTTRKRTEEIDNADIAMQFWNKFYNTLSDITSSSI